MKVTGIYRMPGSRFLWYRWTEAGKRYAVSLKTDDLATAVAKVKAGAYSVRQHSASTFSTPMTRLVEDYIQSAKSRGKKPMREGTAYKQGNILREFLRVEQLERPLDFTRERIESFLSRKKSLGRSADTVHTNARVLHSFALYCVAHNLLPEVVHEFDIPIRSPSGRKNWLDLKVANRVISNAENVDLRFILFCGFHAGMRKSEILNAKVSWFDLDSSFIHVQNDLKNGYVTKDRENRTIPLTAEFHDFLRSYLTNKEVDAFALRPKKHDSKRVGVYRYEFNKSFRTHIRNCGVVCNVHDMRRSFASNLVSHGESIYIVAKWLGDSVQVVERSYGHLSPSAGNINMLSG